MASEPNFCDDEAMVSVDFRIEAGDWQPEADLEVLTQSTLNMSMSNKTLQSERSVMIGAEVSVLFTDDSHIATINSEFRGQQKPTNVLSFPQNHSDSLHFGPYLGDIVLAFETIFREATLEKKDFNHHVQHLMVHGFLHLLGYDHETDKDASFMESLEIDILRDLAIENPYKDVTEK